MQAEIAGTAKETEYPYSTLEAAITKIKELEEKELNNNYIGNQYKRDVNIKGHMIEMEY